MATLFLVDGASGTGKSDLVEFAASLAPDTRVLMKATTRPMRDYEIREGTALDLRFYSDEQFQRLRLPYVYEYGGFFYGVSAAELDDLLRTAARVFLIVRNIPVTRRIRADYGQSHRVITVYVHSDPHKVRERLRLDRRPYDEIRFRLSRIGLVQQDFQNNPDFYDEIITNNGSRRDYRASIRSLLAKYSASGTSDADRTQALR